MEHGYSAADAVARAPAQVYATVQGQAAMLGFLDCFWLLGCIAFVGPFLAILVRKFNQGGKAPAH